MDKEYLLLIENQLMRYPLNYIYLVIMIYSTTNT